MSVDAGIHPQVRRISAFTDEEQQILRKFGTEWYVTKGGEIWLGPSEEKSSKYRYLLIKPTPMYQNMFNIDRELIVLFSPYENFEPRTLDAIDKIQKDFQQLRLEKICSVLVSKDLDIEAKIRDLLKSDEESQIIVPISYGEVMANANDDYFLRNKFRNHFYSRDLFAFEGPLKKDLYFFGRTDLVHRIVNRFQTNENSGLFGLRKSGKTSVIFGIERALHAQGSASVVIDCHDPAFHQRRWYEALWYVVFQLSKKYNLDIKLKHQDKYTAKDASMLFEEDICKISRMLNGNILLIFDEIENITFGISASEHWANELDFVFFWQSLRSLYQRLENVFSYLIVGTNPMCIEESKIHGKANPIFMSVPFEYIEPFDVPQTRDMVRKLSRIMGLQFDEPLYSRLTEDYGGHPFLIRHVCSVIHKRHNEARPVRVSRASYDEARRIFDKEYAGYIEMILEVLQDYYPDEYDMLQFLAIKDMEIFDQFARTSPSYTNHLRGYGIIEQDSHTHNFRIEAIRKYLETNHKYKKVTLTIEEKWSEISDRRNRMEIRLRELIRVQLYARYGPEAGQKALAVYDDRRKNKYAAKPYKSLFNPNECDIYLEDLRKVINKEWDVFRHILGPDQERISSGLKAINELRSDAHAKEVTTDEMAYFRVCIGYIEGKLEEYS